MTGMRAALAAVTLVSAGAARAQELSFSGLADLRLVSPSDRRSWMDGGLGKLGFPGGGDHEPDLRFGAVLVDGKANLAPELDLFATLRHDAAQDTTLDALEAYARYRPVSTQAWQWSVKLGAFFPPISLENDGVGWTSPWTLTSSAINTWVGEELRTIGGETSVEWRHGSGALEITGALFGLNGPAGTLLNYRGWSLGDRPVGLLDTIRQPDTAANRRRHAIPMRNEPWVQIGDSLSWYGGVAWREDGLGRIMLLRYDNKADPREFTHDQYGWKTRFTSLGAETQIGETVLLAQLMSGDTEVDPSPTFRSVTRFHAGYLLAGQHFGRWSAAARLDVFATQEDHNGTRADLSERGYAVTAALSWAPAHWMRIIGEVLRVDSYRGDRVNEDGSPRAVETQYQLAARIFF